MSRLDRHLVRALDKGRDPQRLATAAHELGHALGELAGGGGVEQIRLKFGFLGGVSGGWCEFSEDARQADKLGWTRDRKIGRLVAWMAGPAAEARFRQLYLDTDPRRAFKQARSWADGDYQDFNHYRRKFGLRWLSPERAFDQASDLLERQARRLDELTVRLERARHIDGGAL